MRAGLARLLAERGFEVVGEAGDATALLRLVARDAPDAALVDIKLPPTHTDEGVRAAVDDPRGAPVGRRCCCSRATSTSRYAAALLGQPPGGRGLPAQGARRRSRRSSPSAAAGRRRRVRARPRDRHPAAQPLARARPARRALAARARDPGLMAEGHSNAAICARLLPQPEDRRVARAQHLRQARPGRVAGQQPARAGRAHVPARLTRRARSG